MRVRHQPTEPETATQHVAEDGVPHIQRDGSAQNQRLEGRVARCLAEQPEPGAEAQVGAAGGGAC